MQNKDVNDIAESFHSFVVHLPQQEQQQQIMRLGRKEARDFYVAVYFDFFSFFHIALGFSLLCIS